MNYQQAQSQLEAGDPMKRKVWENVWCESWGGCVYVCNGASMRVYVPSPQDKKALDWMIAVEIPFGALTA